MLTFLKRLIAAFWLSVALGFFALFAVLGFAALESGLQAARSSKSLPFAEAALTKVEGTLSFKYVSGDDCYTSTRGVISTRDPNTLNWCGKRFLFVPDFRESPSLVLFARRVNQSDFYRLDSLLKPTRVSVWYSDKQQVLRIKDRAALLYEKRAPGAVSSMLSAAPMALMFFLLAAALATLSRQALRLVLRPDAPES